MANKFGMPDDEYRRMRLWCKRNYNDPAVRKWVEENPPPKEWEGSRIEWAYTEMPTPW